MLNGLDPVSVNCQELDSVNPLFWSLLASENFARRLIYRLGLRVLAFLILAVSLILGAHRKLTISEEVKIIINSKSLIQMPCRSSSG
jgi:hypothetical protein